MSIQNNGMSCPVLEIPKKTIVKASFAGCPISDRKLFPISRCILPISIMQKKEHEAHRFEATMKLVNSSFKASSLLIVDSLYRYTLKIDYPHETERALTKMATQAGDDWLERNAMALKQLTIPYRIIRWNECLWRDDFSEQYDIINKLYNSDLVYRQAIDSTAEEYLTRQMNNFANTDVELLRSKQSAEEICRTHSNFNYDHAFSCCVNYLKEECAAMCLYSKPPFKEHEFEVYPTGRATALAITYERLIKPFYPNLLKPVSIRFKK
jgi:hypothetical protein